MKIPTMATMLFLCLLLPALAPAQSGKLSLDQALQMAHSNNLQLSANRLIERYNELMTGTASILPNTLITADFGQVNSLALDNKLSISQTFSFPSVYKKQKQLLIDQWKNSQVQTLLQQASIDQMVRTAYLQIEYVEAKQRLLVKMDSLYGKMQHIAALRHREGESSLLEKTTLDNELAQIRLQMQMIASDRQSAQAQLAALLHQKNMPEITDTLNSNSYFFDTSLLQKHPYLEYYRQQQTMAADMTIAEKSKLSPELILGYSNQSFVGWQMNKAQQDRYYDWKNRFSSGQVGVAVPLFNKAQKNKIKAAQANEQVAQANLEVANQQLAVQLQKWQYSYQKSLTAVQYYQTSALPQALVIVDDARKQYSNGAINYLEWVMLMRNALNIQNGYIDQLNELQTDIIQLQYLLSVH